MSRFTGAIVGLVMISCAVALSGDPPRAASPASASASTQPSAPHDFDELVRRIAGEYRERYQRIDDQYRVAPALCLAYAPASEFRLSRSKDPESHGRKLYRLYASRPSEYTSLGQGKTEAQAPAPRQTIVKESWVAAISNDPRDLHSPHAATRDGITYVPGDQRDLFIMTQLDPATPATDEGWVYATVSADGKTVGASGRLASCMGCHADAPHGRLFGLTAPGITRPTTAPRAREGADD